MISIWRIVCALIAVLGLIASHSAFGADSGNREAAYRSALPLYRYNAKAPLSVKVAETSSEAAGQLLRLSYVGSDKERIPAVLFIPARANPAVKVPCLILLHGLGGTKETMLPLARYLAQHGYASLAIDEYGQGERAAQSKASRADLSTTLSTGLRNTAIDVRRGLDYLGTRPEIDRKRIGLVGLSMGAIVGTIAAGVDTRIKAIVLASGGGDLGLILKSLADRNANIGGGSMGDYKSMDWNFVGALLAAEDPLTFAAHIAPRPLLMEHGRGDRVIIPAAAEALYEAARSAPHSDVTIHWYPDSGHILPASLVFPDAIAWLSQKL